MNAQEIAKLRVDLGLSQMQFAQLFGTHFMTISKWERGLLAPNDYQQALLDKFRQTADQQKAQMKEKLGKLLVGAGVIAALILLLTGR
jgi:DNA-binding transcriptional regulator YiaG